MMTEHIARESIQDYYGKVLQTKRVRLFSAKLPRLSRRPFEFIILRYRNIVPLTLLVAMEGNIVLEIAAGA